MQDSGQNDHRKVIDLLVKF